MSAPSAALPNAVGVRGGVGAAPGRTCEPRHGRLATAIARIGTSVLRCACVGRRGPRVAPRDLASVDALTPARPAAVGLADALTAQLDSIVTTELEAGAATTACAS